MELATLPLLATLLASGDEGTSTGAAVMQYGILLLIPVAMYFLLIRPQRKRAKDQAAMQSALGVGDEVITTSGVYGFITGEEADLFWLEIDDDVQIRVAKAAIQRKVTTSADKVAKADAAEAGADTSADQPES
jgi:preprotein translocase subunit YajC